MHATFKSEELLYMATDGMSVCATTVGNNISLSLHLSDEDEQTKVFDLLSENGTVMMALENVFLGSRFGMRRDQFGSHLMLSCNQA